MPVLHWLGQNWFEIFSSAGIVASSLFTAFSLRSETTTRQIANLIAITRNHRELWSEYLGNPRLQRVLDPVLQKSNLTVSREEEMFVISVILHLSGAFEAMRAGLCIKPEGLRRDIAQFFSLPVPQVVWEKSRVLQDDEFVQFVESCLNWK